MSCSRNSLIPGDTDTRVDCVRSLANLSPANIGETEVGVRLTEATGELGSYPASISCCSSPFRLSISSLKTECCGVVCLDFVYPRLVEAILEAGLVRFVTTGVSRKLLLGEFEGDLTAIRQGSLDELPVPQVV